MKTTYRWKWNKIFNVRISIEEKRKGAESSGNLPERASIIHGTDDDDDERGFALCRRRRRRPADGDETQQHTMALDSDWESLLIS